ncbi:MAG: Ig-like domain-containing protein [Candidatus Symbiothrix sp.]|jgi:hypothetical protein|nr:Ig-like domain-containing protein [Candidatus Symbiothrix sp.]
MKRIYLLVVATLLVTANWSPATAQVAIGGDGSVATGAVLDLSQQGAASGGLLLPQVVLTAENANPFGEGESTELSDGLMVYNLGGDGYLDAGLYVTQEGLWKSAGSGGGGDPVLNVAVTPNTPLTLLPRTTGGAIQQLEFTTYPTNATYKSMSWNSSNPEVATVSNLGVVTGVAPGNTNITLSLGSVTSDPVAVTVANCGGTFTAPSGKIYNTAAYGNANLTNLCWTTSNLQEAGYMATCFNRDCNTYPTRGYYYDGGSAPDNACAELNSGGVAWHAPTTAEWAALMTAFPSLTEGVGTHGDTPALQRAWNSVGDMAGEAYPNFANWLGYGEFAHTWYSGSILLARVLLGKDTMSQNSYTQRYASVRCVHSL